MDLHHLSDPALRLHTAAQRLRHEPGDEWFDWLEAQGLALWAPPQHRRASALAVVRALILEPPEAVAWPTLYEAARARGRLDLAEIFRLPEGPGDTLARPLLDRELLEQGVGRRVALARRAPINMMERLVLDHEPRVIEALLESPRIRTQEVLRVTTYVPCRRRSARCSARIDGAPSTQSFARSRNETLVDRWGSAPRCCSHHATWRRLPPIPKATLRAVARSLSSLASRGALKRHPLTTSL